MDLEIKETKYINTDGYTYTYSSPLDLEHCILVQVAIILMIYSPNISMSSHFKMRLSHLLRKVKKTSSVRKSLNSPSNKKRIELEDITSRVPIPLNDLLTRVQKAVLVIFGAV